MTFGESQRLKTNTLPYKKIINQIEKHNIKNIYYMTYKSSETYSRAEIHRPLIGIKCHMSHGMLK